MAFQDDDRANDGGDIPDENDRRDDGHGAGVAFDNIGSSLTESLPVKLTDDEVYTFGLQLARQCEALMQREDEKKSVMKAFGEEITTMKDEGGRLTRIVNDRTEWRDVEVYESINRAEGLVTKYRKDTQEVVSTRAMTKQERQMKMGYE